MLGRIHLFLGILLVILFLLTGQYMHHNFNHLKDMDLMNRALFRAGHLYILLFGLINASLGAHLKLSEIKWIKSVQQFGSVVIFLASFLVIYGFFKELPTQNIERPITQYSLYFILFGVSIHGLISLVINKKTNVSNT